MGQQHHHFVLVTFPAQGHINPALQLAKRLTNIGVHVTFLINTFTRRRMIESPNYVNFTLSEFSDGYDDGHSVEEADHFFSEFKRHAVQTLSKIITTNNQPTITCLVYSLFLPWAAEVAHELHVKPVLFWIQPAIVFDIYYYYFNHIDDDNIGKKINNSDIKLSHQPTWSITFPNLSLPFTMRGLPSFINPTNTHKFATSAFQEHVKMLGKEINPRVLVNTFDALESEALSALSDVDLVAIGPMVPSENSTTINLFEPSDGKYIDWLNKKPKSSVVYISFGSLATLTDKQVDEIQKGLLKSGKHYLWVMRTAGHQQNGESPGEDERTMTVTWCNQNEVLSHPSVGCFLTHCGWNSTLESIVAGKPMVGFPQWSDQGTNAMLVEELWKIGVRVNVNEGEDRDIVSGDEITRCLEIVMGGGERGEEIRKNAAKYKALALEALSESNGPSNKNLQTFVDQLAH